VITEIYSEESSSLLLLLWGFVPDFTVDDVCNSTTGPRTASDTEYRSRLRDEARAERKSHRNPTGVCTTISNLICRNHRFALFINFCICEGTKISTLTAISLYRWPPLHRPGVTHTAHQHGFTIHFGHTAKRG
jgi:hypothetical protein